MQSRRVWLIIILLALYRIWLFKSIVKFGGGDEVAIFVVSVMSYLTHSKLCQDKQ